MREQRSPWGKPKRGRDHGMGDSPAGRARRVGGERDRALCWPRRVWGEAGAGCAAPGLVPKHPTVPGTPPATRGFPGPAERVCQGTAEFLKSRKWQLS